MLELIIFFGFLRLGLSPWRYNNRCFLVTLRHLIVRRPNLEVPTKRFLHQHVNCRGSFSTMTCMEVCPYIYFRWCGYFQGTWVSFVTTEEFSVRVTKITARIGVSFTHSLPFCFLPVFNSMDYGHTIKMM